MLPRGVFMCGGADGWMDRSPDHALQRKTPCVRLPCLFLSPDIVASEDYIQKQGFRNLLMLHSEAIILSKHGEYFKNKINCKVCSSASVEE